MRIALDAKRYVDLGKGEEETVELVSTAEEVSAADRPDLIGRGD